MGGRFKVGFVLVALLALASIVYRAHWVEAASLSRSAFRPGDMVAGLASVLRPDEAVVARVRDGLAPPFLAAARWAGTSAEGDAGPLWRVLLEAALKWIAHWLERLLSQLVVDASAPGGEAPSANRQYWPTSTAAEAGWDPEAALEIVRLVNEERGKAGLPPLAVDERLMEIARKRAMEVSEDFSHDGLADDCPTCGENAGMRLSGRFSPQVQVAGWMTSKMGHRENLLDPSATRVGVGVHHTKGGKVFSAFLFER